MEKLQEIQEHFRQPFEKAPEAPSEYVVAEIEEANKPTLAQAMEMAKQSGQGLSLNINELSQVPESAIRPDGSVLIDYRGNVAR